MKSKVLHAEDESLIRAFFDEALHFMGYEVVGVADGEAALKRLIQEHFDIVITDHHMPAKGGLELVRALRTNGFCGRIYVVSGALPLPERRAYEALGVDGIANKPLGLMELDRLLRTITASPPKTSAST